MTFERTAYMFCISSFKSDLPPFNKVRLSTGFKNYAIFVFTALSITLSILLISGELCSYHLRV